MTHQPPPHELPTAVVVGLDNMTGLQTARILAGYHIPVLGIANDLDHFACRTKACRAILPANTCSSEVIELLAKIGPEFPEKAVLFPCSDFAVLNISAHRERLADWYHILLPDHDVVEMLMDKTRFAAYASEAGFKIPATCLLASRADAARAATELTFPCILKPAVKAPDWQARTGDKVHRVENGAALLALYDRVQRWADLLMVQEWIPGPDSNLYSCNCYFSRDSEPLVTFIARKLRQWPPEAGTSCLGEEVRNDEALRESVRLFASVGYQGLGYLELKRDERTGIHYLIEPNIGRPTGRSAICEAGGVPLLYTMYCDAVGLPLPPDREQTYTGVKWIYLRRDLQSAYYYWKQGQLSLQEWWDSVRGPKAYAIFSSSDMGPFWGDLLAFLGKGNRSLRRKARDVLPHLAARAPES
jgi:predicted ATP-grasp superfamily ATP-dependent carboligase